MNDSKHPTSDAATAVAEPGTDRAGATKTILLLDAAPVFLRFEETILQRRNWRVLRAGTGAVALDLLSREKVDLLVMDHQLPDLLGEHVIRAIRSTPELRNMAILLVTTRGDQEIVERCMAEGCSSLLYKPVSRQALCATVEQILSVPARRHVRTLVRLKVDAAGGARAFFGNTVNLSVGGMLVESATPMPTGESLDLRFHLPGDPDPVIVMGRVVRSEEDSASGHHACGLAFEHLEDRDRARLEAFVATIDRTPSDNNRESAAC